MFRLSLGGPAALSAMLGIAARKNPSYCALHPASCIHRNANSFITFLSGKLSNVKTWLARNLARLAFLKGRFGGSALRRARNAAWPRAQAPILPLPSMSALPRVPATVCHR